MVIGDQVATDGILARRLGYAFVLVDSHMAGVPAGPRLMGAAGRLLRPLMFTRAADRSRQAPGGHAPLKQGMIVDGCAGIAGAGMLRVCSWLPQKTAD